MQIFQESFVNFVTTCGIGSLVNTALIYSSVTLGHFEQTELPVSLLRQMSGIKTTEIYE